MFDIKDYSSLLGMPGFSDELLNNHFALYQGYVKNTNNALEILKTADSYQYGEIKRRFGWEYNGMRLHELYFDNLINGGTEIPEEIKNKIEQYFNTIEQWKEDFVKTGSMRGIGWAILCHDPQSDRLFNTWINEHDLGLLAGSIPLVVMDVFEHAFVTDYGLKKADYINSFLQNLNWVKVKERLQ